MIGVGDIAFWRSLVCAEHDHAGRGDCQVTAARSLSGVIVPDRRWCMISVACGHPDDGVDRDRVSLVYARVRIV